MKKGLAPIFNNETTILILGSAPSERSLAMQQYYANPGNQFWKVIFQALEASLPTTYQERLDVLLTHHIGLWDVYGQFEREGSLDSQFTKKQVNNFDFLLAHTQLTTILANGNEAYQAIKKNDLFTDLTVYKCPSTSGANNGQQLLRTQVWTDTFQQIKQKKR